jgi:hypothetical protein
MINPNVIFVLMTGEEILEQLDSQGINSVKLFNIIYGYFSNDDRKHLLLDQ